MGNLAFSRRIDEQRSGGHVEYTYEVRAASGRWQSLQKAFALAVCIGDVTLSVRKMRVCYPTDYGTLVQYNKRIARVPEVPQRLTAVVLLIHRCVPVYSTAS